MMVVVVMKFHPFLFFSGFLFSKIRDAIIVFIANNNTEQWKNK